MILVIIGFSVLIFSIWNHLLLKRHLKNFLNNYRHTSSLTDEKYFELKSKQEYIIATSTIIFAVISFIGFSSIKELKSQLHTQIESEIKRIDTLKTSADSTSTTFVNLNIKGKTLQDSFRSALELVEVIKKRVSSISSKDVIRQNIFIIDPFVIDQFPLLTNNKDKGYRLIKFNNLKTISGQALPKFSNAPSVICFSSTNSSVVIKDITNNGFKINPQAYQRLVTESSSDIEQTGTSKLSLWISQKSSNDVGVNF